MRLGARSGCNMHRLTHYNGGSTTHELSRLFRDGEHKKHVFPAGMFLFQHESGQMALFDTGYHPTMKGSGILGALYRKALPPEVEPAHDIAYQLHQDGVSPGDIGYVVLSHLHPDHIGGLRHFPDATVVVSEDVALSLFRKTNPKEGIFKGLIPPWLSSDHMHVIPTEQLGAVSNGQVSGYDLFKDESYIITQLPGHARGQIGAAVVGKSMLAADAAWGREIMTPTQAMRTVPRLVQHDRPAYDATSAALLQLEQHGFALHFSHDVPVQKDLV